MDVTDRVEPRTSRPLKAPAAVAQLVTRVSARFGLSPRETAVVQLLAKGFPPRQIASSLGCAHKTIGTYLKRIYNKTGCQTQALVLAELLHQAVVWEDDEPCRA